MKYCMNKSYLCTIYRSLRLFRSYSFRDVFTNQDHSHSFGSFPSVLSLGRHLRYFQKASNSQTLQSQRDCSFRLLKFNGSLSHLLDISLFACISQVDGSLYIEFKKMFLPPVFPSYRTNSLPASRSFSLKGCSTLTRPAYLFSVLWEGGRSTCWLIE